MCSFDDRFSLAFHQFLKCVLCDKSALQPTFARFPFAFEHGGWGSLVDYDGVTLGEYAVGTPVYRKPKRDWDDDEEQ